MRMVEILLAVVALLLLLPLMILVAVAIRIESRGPCLYRAPRIGRDGVPFTMLKFRTMRVGSDQWGALTRRNDRRVTRVGRFLRRTAIDEWPQFVNVARGEMALVGPRPEDPRYVAKYTADQRRVLSVRPGVTSAASLAFRREEAVQLTGDDWERIYTEQIMPAKLAMELACLDTAHWRTDLHVISRTLLAVLTGGWRDRGC